MLGLTLLALNAGCALAAWGTSATCGTQGGEAPEFLVMLQVSSQSAEKEQASKVLLANTERTPSFADVAASSMMNLSDGAAVRATVSAAGVAFAVALTAALLALLVVGAIFLHSAAKPPREAQALIAGEAASPQRSSFSHSKRQTPTVPESSPTSLMRAPLNMDLVVPAGSDCILNVSIPGPETTALITNINGTAILQAVPKWEQPKAKVPTEFGLPWMELQTASGQVLAAFAKMAIGRQPTYAIFRPEFELFGKIAQQKVNFKILEQPVEYRLETVSGDSYRVTGSVQENCMQMEGPSGTLVAETERLSDHSLLLRAMPLMDTGIVVCTLLSLKCFE